jgi:hypothetical protein
MSCAGFAAFFFCPGLSVGAGVCPVEGRHNTQYKACNIASVGASPSKVFTGSSTNVRKLKRRIERSKMGWRLAYNSDNWDCRMSTGFEDGTGAEAFALAGE